MPATTTTTGRSARASSSVTTCPASARVSRCVFFSQRMRRCFIAQGDRMLPGKVYRPEDVLWILRRRYWLILVPFAVAAAATSIYARGLPNLYRSEAVLQVVSQRVPEKYVSPTVTMSLQARLQAIRSLILSRTRLERL